jgi:hypothetical protein
LTSAAFGFVVVMFKLPQWWSRGKPGGSNTADSLDAFGSEQPGGKSARHVRPASVGVSQDWLRRLRVPVAIALLIGIGTAGYFLKWRPFNVEAASASLTIESDPAGAEVIASGSRVGVTPLIMPIAPGEHDFELVYQGRRKPLRTVVRARAAVVYHVLFDSPPSAAVPTKASLSIVTEPARLRVLLDGKALGVSPLLATELEPGAHTIEVLGANGRLERKVDLYAGETASVIISAALAPITPGLAAGWLTVLSPVALQIVEGGNLVGTSQSAKILLPAGRHELQLTNEVLGISERRTVQVTSGANATLRIEVPNAPLSINALPWAEVWVDGKRVGETPIGNYQVSVGTHEVVFRHPELGERRQTVTVSLKKPSRVSVDMRKPQ